MKLKVAEQLFPINTLAQRIVEEVKLKILLERPQATHTLEGMISELPDSDTLLNKKYEL